MQLTLDQVHLVRLLIELAVQLLSTEDQELAEAWDLHREITVYLKGNV